MPRLPQPGSDDGTWGDILNDYLSAAHAGDGSLKPNSVTSTSLAPGAVSATELSDDTVTEPKLHPDVRTKLNAVGGSGGSTNLTTSTSGSTVTINSDTGSDAVIPAATTSTAGVLSASDKTKLDGVASGGINAYGVRPTLYYDGSTWPPRTLPSGYTGAVTWDSVDYTNVSPPTSAIDGDRWIRRSPA